MATYLADKSALTRRDTRPEVRAVIEPLLLAGRIATCGIIDLSVPDLRNSLRAQVFAATGGRGADVVIDYKTEAFDEQLSGYDLVFDVLGQEFYLR